MKISVAVQDHMYTVKKILISIFTDLKVIFMRTQLFEKMNW
jgi:hypothetical protein